ncbi:MAG TPA: hypothetical protein VMY34_07620, partial [Acidimicrobiales bacterium]|nr:hypothetical protein [Acidimicrobiales bacterium]
MARVIDGAGGTAKPNATLREAFGSLESVQRGWAASVRAVARRPALWSTALRQAVRLARPGWWHRRPFLPLPDPDYLRFRMVTAYG